jgi:Cdc6-like AAA superfamily ATPase
MSLATKVMALLASLSPSDIAELSPFERRRLADLCRHVAELAEREKKELPKAEFITELADGRGRG